MTEPDAEPLHSLLFTDLYQLTMSQAYLAERMESTSVFELFFRTLPQERNYIVAAGLDDVLDALEHLHVTDADIDYLRSLRTFSEPLLDWLRSFQFSGDVYAVPEGTVVLVSEPIPARYRCPRDRRSDQTLWPRLRPSGYQPPGCRCGARAFPHPPSLVARSGHRPDQGADPGRARAALHLRRGADRARCAHRSARPVGGG